MALSIICTILINIIIFLTTSVVAVYMFYKTSFTYWKRRGVPVLYPTIPFGDLQNLFTRKISRMEELTIMYNKIKEKGYRRYCGIYQLTCPTLFVVDLDLIKNICIKDFEHFVDRGFYSNEKVDPIGSHLLSLTGDRWKYARKTTSTIFTISKLKGVFRNIKECVHTLVEFIEKNSENGNQPMYVPDLLSCYTADSVGSSTLGINCRSFTDPEKTFVKVAKKALEVSRVDQFWLLLGLWFPDLCRKLGIRQISVEVSNFFYKVISESIKKRKESNVVRKDLLQLLMDLHYSTDKVRCLSFDEVVAQSFGLFVGGFETSSNVLSFTLYYLAKHQEYQERAREEIHVVLKKFDNKLTYEAVQELEYVQKCIDETIRLHPPVHTMNRVCTKNYKVPGEDLVIKKGTKILITLTGIHQDSEFYEHPNEYYPDHFSDENRLKRHPLAYMPFGIGPRYCIGKRYGILTLRTALAALLSKFRITVDKKTQEKIKLPATAFLPVAKGIYLNFQKI